MIDLLEEEYCLMFRGVQGVFRLRAGKSGSFLYYHQPLWANNYTNVEIVASFHGGGKRPKADKQDPIIPKSDVPVKQPQASCHSLTAHDICILQTVNIISHHPALVITVIIKNQPTINQPFTRQ